MLCSARRPRRHISRQVAPEISVHIFVGIVHRSIVPVDSVLLLCRYRCTLLFICILTILTLSILLTPAKWETLHLTLCRPKLLSYNSQVFGPYCLHKLTHTVPFPVLTSVSTSHTTTTTSSRWTCLAQSSNLPPGNVVPLQAQEERAYDFLSSPTEHHRHLICEDVPRGRRLREEGEASLVAQVNTSPWKNGQRHE